MNYHLHKNNWTVIVDNIDLKKATQEDVNLIAKLIAFPTFLLFILISRKSK